MVGGDLVASTIYPPSMAHCMYRLRQCVISISLAHLGSICPRANGAIKGLCLPCRWRLTTFNTRACMRTYSTTYVNKSLATSSYHRRKVSAPSLMREVRWPVRWPGTTATALCRFGLFNFVCFGTNCLFHLTQVSVRRPYLGI